MSTSTPAADAFEFYPCLVDGAHASIYVNLRYEGATPITATTRYELVVALLSPGAFGIGEGDEVDILDAAEAVVIARAAQLDVEFVGRLRHRGLWELTLYGPPGHLASLEAALRAGVGERRIQVSAEHDAGWRYYNELLLPDAERRRWMDDRRLVQILIEQGDRLQTPRRVDHQASFPNAVSRDEYVADVVRAGFAVEHASDDAPFTVTVWRNDPIELDHIHDVVMTLVDAATARGGTYEQWIAGIEG